MRNYHDLAFLASLSAIAIDFHINKKANEKDYSNVKDLSKKLDELSKEHLDPISLFMLAEVIWPNKEDLKGKQDGNFYLQTNLLAKDLACFREFPRERQEELRDVCVELSKRSMYYSDSYGLELAA
jgi:hypothetical protein